MSAPQPRHILVAIDGSTHAEAAWHVALGLARGTGAHLTILHVAVPRARSGIEISGSAALRAESAARQSGERLLDEVRAAAEGSVPCTTELVFGDPADVIIERAEALAVEQIVLGSRGLGLLDRLLLGSVSAAVVQRAVCSVLIVHPPVTQAS